jgi:hypothetical protein
VGNLFVHQTFSQKNKLGISFQYQQNSLSKSFGSRYDIQELSFNLPDALYYGVVYERDWDEIFCDLDLNFSAIKFGYQWILESSNSGGSREYFAGKRFRREEEFQGGFNFIGLNLIMGAKFFELGNKAFVFYFYYGLKLDFPCYMAGNYKIRFVNESSTYYGYNVNSWSYTSSDTTIYWNSTFRFSESILLSFPIGIRYRVPILKRLCFDFNIGFRPQLNHFGPEQFYFRNGINFGALLTIPFKQKPPRISE